MADSFPLARPCPPDDRRLSRRRVVLGAAAGIAAPWARAQAAYPSKQVTIIVPYTAGGASDIGARMLAAELGKALGQPVVIDNVPGAGGALGVQKMLRAPADGHTLMYGSLSECVLVPLINPTVGYKSEDMLAVAMGGSAAAAFVVKPDFPANTMEEWIAYARKNPGKLSYGSPGIGTFQHLVAEVVKARTGTFMLHIPYRGGANIMTDVVAGQIDIGVTTVPNVIGLGAQGRVKILGVTSADRVAVLPGVAGFGETPSLKGMDLQSWNMVFAPRGVPDAALQKLNAAINAIVVLPSLAEQRRRLGATLLGPFTLAQAQAFLLKERDTYRAAASRIKPE
jgi:tripartite-type tricarboxylate transporter receptor subunit TctC